MFNVAWSALALFYNTFPYVLQQQPDRSSDRARSGEGATKPSSQRSGEAAEGLLIDFSSDANIAVPTAIMSHHKGSDLLTSLNTSRY